MYLQKSSCFVTWTKFLTLVISGTIHQYAKICPKRQASVGVFFKKKNCISMAKHVSNQGTYIGAPSSLLCLASTWMSGLISASLNPDKARILFPSSVPKPMKPVVQINDLLCLSTLYKNKWDYSYVKKASKWSCWNLQHFQHGKNSPNTCTCMCMHTYMCKEQMELLRSEQVPLITQSSEAAQRCVKMRKVAAV